ncbi:LolA family protein [Hyphococcus sp.]|uniref:LolA family protein n=1 Tax=Hyphococcus sp. TaxID=2038636 RepID=UPI00207F1D12|nr:MAG: outer-membrane lipoprotein carrier protein [Marinicaulis sp.]
MSFALLSAISLMCADGASAARPLAALPVISAAAAVQEQETAAEGIKVEEITLQPAMPADSDAAVAPSTEVQNDGAHDGPLAMENESDEAISEKLIAWLESVDTLKGDFTQIAPSGAISEGKFYLRRPGFLRFEYEPPTPLLIVANGGLVYVRDNDLETTDSYPTGKTPLKFLLAKKIDRDDAKVIRVDRGVDTVAVTFASTDEETEGELTIIADAPDFALRRWIVRDLQGGTTVVTLSDVVSGERIAMSLFATPDAGGRFLNR